MPLEVISKAGEPPPYDFALVYHEPVFGKPAHGILSVARPQSPEEPTRVRFIGRVIDGDFIQVITPCEEQPDLQAALDIVRRQELDGVKGHLFPKTPFPDRQAQYGYECFVKTLKGFLIFARGREAVERRVAFASSLPMTYPFIDDGLLSAIDEGRSVSSALTDAVGKQILGDRSQFAFTDDHMARLSDAPWSRLPHSATALFLLGHLKPEQMPRTEREGQCAIVLGRLMKAVQDEFEAFFEPGSRDEVCIPQAMLARGLDADWEALIALVESASGVPLEKAFDAVRGVDIAIMLSGFDQMVLYWVPSEAWPRGRYRFATETVLQGGNIVDLLRAFELYIKGPGGPSYGKICDDRALSFEAWRPLLPDRYRDMTVAGFEAQMYRERAVVDAAEKVLS